MGLRSAAARAFQLRSPALAADTYRLPSLSLLYVGVEICVDLRLLPFGLDVVRTSSRTIRAVEVEQTSARRVLASFIFGLTSTFSPNAAPFASRTQTQEARAQYVWLAVSCSSADKGLCGAGSGPPIRYCCRPPPGLIVPFSRTPETSTRVVSGLEARAEVLSTSTSRRKTHPYCYSSP